MLLIPFLDGLFSYVGGLIDDLDEDKDLPESVYYASARRYSELETKVLKEVLKLHNIKARFEDTSSGTITICNLKADDFISVLSSDMSSQPGIGIYNKLMLIRYMDSIERGTIDAEFEIPIENKGDIINLMSLQMFFNSLGIETEINNTQSFPIPVAIFKILGSSIRMFDVESNDVFIQLLYHKLSNFIETSKSREFYEKNILLNKVDDFSHNLFNHEPLKIDLSSFSKSYRGDIVRKVLSYNNLTASFNEEFMIVDKN